jgi:hypothetical protein
MSDVSDKREALGRFSGEPMITWAHERDVWKALVLVTVAAATSAGYALDSFNHLQAMRGSAGAVIPSAVADISELRKGQLPDSGFEYNIPIAFSVEPLRSPVVDRDPRTVDPTQIVVPK